MGSLTRSTPSVQQYASISPTVSTITETETQNDANENNVNDEDNQETIRRIARRNRGVGSTILTSFSGVNDALSSTPKRKNLLGD
jgi:hypothetical protein